MKAQAMAVKDSGQGQRVHPRVACVLFSERLEDAAVRAFAEACFRFSPQIAIRAGEAIFIEIGASRRLFSEQGLEARVKVLARRMLRKPVQVAVADSAAEALASARYPEFATTRDLKRLPLAALHDYAHPFLWDPDLEKRVLRIICILESLGITNLGGFATLPRASLASRLGKEAVSLMARVWGDLEIAWPGFHPLPSITERDEVRDPEAHGLCYNLEGCVFVLRPLVDRAMARLRGRGERVLIVEVRFGMSSGPRGWLIEFALPQGSASGMIPIIHEKLAHELRRAPLGGPVEWMELEVIESVPGSGPQKDFFSRKEEEREAWDALVARLSERLGKERVFVAFPRERYLPEKAYLRRTTTMPIITDSRSGPVLKIGRSPEMSDWVPRPARVLKQPEPLLKEGRALKTLGGRQWKAVSWEGPERLSGEWWKDSEFEGFSRDYYRVITEGGEQLWVFVNKKAHGSKAPSFFLHGYFD
jgi:protein ImuB